SYDYRIAPTESQCRAFFFQAEDGIRDFHVTGVQTCALPISIATLQHRPARILDQKRPTPNYPRTRSRGRVRQVGPPVRLWEISRSEERRVGKEGRSRWGRGRGRERERGGREGVGMRGDAENR